MNMTLRIFEPESRPERADCREAQSFFEQATGWLAVLIGFSIPISTSLSEIATSSFLLCWLLAGDWRNRGRLIAGNPVAKLSLAMFGLLLVATSWSTTTWMEALRCLLKYREFVYLPLLIPVFHDARIRERGMRGFMAGATVMLGLSYFEWLSGFDVGQTSDPNTFVIAKDRIIHSMLMALLAYFSALNVMRSGRWRMFHLATIPLAVLNILYLVPGRTGCLMLGLLTVLFVAQPLGRRGLMLGCLLVGAAGCGAYFASAAVRDRVVQTISQLQNQFSAQKKPSLDPRLEFYEHTLTLIGQRPVLGSGTGSFSREYTAMATSKGLRVTNDPHNEYLLLAVQAGLPATALFLGLLAVQWRFARQMPEPQARIGRGIVLAIAAGSLFNSLILSVTGGLVWSYFGAIAGSGTRPGSTSAHAPVEVAATRRAA